MSIILKNTKIPVTISKEKNEDIYLIEGDASYSNGLLHFSHEFSFSISFSHGNLEFLGGYEIASEDIDYEKGEAGLSALKFYHPGLIEDIIEEIKNLK